MISFLKIQQNYVDLYKCMRNYIWPFHTVEILAELEIETYKTFPDVSRLRRLCSALYNEVRSTSALDEDFQKALDEYRDTISTDDSLYAKLLSVKEVVPNEDIKEQQD